MSHDNDLGDACEVWQSGRDGGSTPLRAAARILSSIPHYFSAPFITALDDKARGDEVGLARAAVLMAAVSKSTRLTAEGWRQTLGVSGSGHASRGIAAKSDDPLVDQQIEDLVTSPGAELVMPLWGFSLSEDIAVGYGSRFLFRLVGEFHAVPAWVHSGILPEEQELIGSGRYAVVATHLMSDTLVVDLEQVGLVPFAAEEV